MSASILETTPECVCVKLIAETPALPNGHLDLQRSRRGLLLLSLVSGPLRKDMAMASFGGGGDAFAPFWNPTRDVAHSSSRGGRDMHLDVMEVNCHQKNAFQQATRTCGCWLCSKFTCACSTRASLR